MIEACAGFLELSHQLNCANYSDDTVKAATSRHCIDMGANHN